MPYIVRQKGSPRKAMAIFTPLAFGLSSVYYLLPCTLSAARCALRIVTQGPH